ncbi:MAG TPA: hypothetical protein VMA53_06955 [Stellaceae bacterium]|nr:hypothetical protein [Stellaceae bacterium]
MLAAALMFAAVMLCSVVAAAAESFSDPIAYCRAVRTIDKPDARYDGAKLPAWMAAKLHLDPSQGKLMEWRCARGAVLACLYGANIPCDAKADTSRTPTPALAAFCRENPNATVVPMVVTGHETVVSWACKGGQPVPTKVGAVDAEGYAKAYWRRVAP